MKLFKKLSIAFPVFIALFIFASPTYAAAPDGLGPWADNVFSSNQGVMKNGLPVPVLRSDPTAALGVAEDDTADNHFFSLGFGGNIVLGFDNGISSGVFIVEATNPNYALEKAKVEVSENATTWINAGTVTQDGSVNVPDQVACAKYVRITDISDSAIMPDAIADGYDIDGAQAIGDACTPVQSPTPTPTNSPSNPNPTPTNTPGFPNTGTSCTSSGVSSVPNITQARRVSPTSIFVAWGPNAGLNNFIVEYGFQNGNWQFNTKTSGFSTTINDLPANQSIWIRVAATDNCAVGSFGTAVLVGGTATTNSPGFPNTGNLIPRLPNTGIGPIDITLPLGIIAGALLIFITFSLAKRAYKFSSK